MPVASRLSSPTTHITAAQARRVLLHLQGLSCAPVPSSAARVVELVRRLGYVQIDSINVVERAHHLILGARLDGYRAEHLAHPLERTRRLFEHWTHDACAIPIEWIGHWKHRFASHAARSQESAWWQSHFRGDESRTIARTLARVRRSGELRARDCGAAQTRNKGWWSWHPEKAALEHLWRTGKLAIARRERFEKVYDLIGRVLPSAQNASKSAPSQHIHWACTEAIARMGIATPLELARFFCAVSSADAAAWCRAAAARGEIIEVVVDRAGGVGGATKAFALPNWLDYCEAAIDDRMRILAPFDPVGRDRARLMRLFAFDYRFEAFTPAPQRVYGYYTMPLLVGDRFVGRIDPKFDRASGTLLVRGPWWENRSPRSGARGLKGQLASALDRLAQQIGAKKWHLVKDSK